MAPICSAKVTQMTQKAPKIWVAKVTTSIEEDLSAEVASVKIEVRRAEAAARRRRALPSPRLAGRRARPPVADLPEMEAPRPTNRIYIPAAAGAEAFVIWASTPSTTTVTRPASSRPTPCASIVAAHRSRRRRRSLARFQSWPACRRRPAAFCISPTARSGTSNTADPLATLEDAKACAADEAQWMWNRNRKKAKKMAPRWQLRP